MNHKETGFAAPISRSVLFMLCSLFLCDWNSFAAKLDEPRRYNAGVTAYQSNDFTQAAMAFETATASTDRALQERALYNLGNATYRLGQEQPAQAQQLWQRAIKHYESALALNPRDADANFNQEFVKKKLEELKKQQEQQQQQQQQNQKNQQDKKQEQNKDEQKDQEKKQDQQQQNSKADQSKQQEQQQSQQSPEQKQEQKDKQQQQQQAQQQKSDQPEQKPPEKPGEPGNYDKMQSTALLNDLRENEQNWNFFPEVQMKDLKDSGAPVKDW